MLKKNILFVDDDEAMADLFDMRLGRRGFNLVYATSCKTALAAIIDKQFNAAIID